MKKTICALCMLCGALNASCERSNMHNLAKYGLPPQTAIYLYPIGTKTGNLGGKNSIDSNCYDAGSVFISMTGAKNVEAFLSHSQYEEIRYIVPTEYWGYPVYGINPATMNLTLISETWLGLWDGTLSASIDVAVGITGFNWWSGSNYDGSVIAGVTCSEWHSSNATETGEIGISGSTSTCDIYNYVLCVAY